MSRHPYGPVKGVPYQTHYNSHALKSLFPL